MIQWHKALSKIVFAYLATIVASLLLMRIAYIATIISAETYSTMIFYAILFFFLVSFFVSILVLFLKKFNKLVT